MSHPDPEPSSRSRLLEAAILCFAEQGFDATGIRDIARRAKANSALVQYHFGGKTGLYAEALRHIFSSRPALVPGPPERADLPEARPRAIQAVGDMIESLLNVLIACREGSELDKASLMLVTREMQNPRADVAELVLEHMRPYSDHMQACLKILRPDLDWLAAMDYTQSILGQVVHLLHHLALIRLTRGDPGYPGDLPALARHITAFSLRGIGIPEAFPGA
jgi:AcrR family transcriptional regulator